MMDEGSCSAVAAAAEPTDGVELGVSEATGVAHTTKGLRMAERAANPGR